MKKLLILVLVSLTFIALTGCEEDDFGHGKHLSFSRAHVAITSITENTPPSNFKDARDLRNVDQKLDLVWVEAILHSEPSITHADNLVVTAVKVGSKSDTAVKVAVKHFRRINISDNNLLDDKEFVYFALDFNAIDSDGDWDFDLKFTNDDDKKASKIITLTIENTGDIALP